MKNREAGISALAPRLADPDLALRGSEGHPAEALAVMSGGLRASMLAVLLHFK